MQFDYCINKIIIKFNILSSSGFCRNIYYINKVFLTGTYCKVTFNSKFS